MASPKAKEKVVVKTVERTVVLVRGKPETALRIGIRSVILTSLVAICTWMATSVLDYEAPSIVTASQHQFSNSNEAYKQAHALATSDPTTPVLFIAGVMYILVWGVAGWQWWKLAQEGNEN